MDYSSSKIITIPAVRRDLNRIVLSCPELDNVSSSVDDGHCNDDESPKPWRLE